MERGGVGGGFCKPQQSSRKAVHVELKTRFFGKRDNVVIHVCEKLVHGTLLQDIKVVQEHLQLDFFQLQGFGLSS